MNSILKTENFIYGGDYNPDQWFFDPEILKKDIELFKEAKINCVTVGVFSWATMEPSEGEYHMEKYVELVNNLYENGIYTILSTPSGARPKWMSDKYPEVLRVVKDRHRILFSMRHNHCLTSKVYKEKVYNINKKLSETFKDNKGVILWHLSNEYSGECYCDSCQQGFRDWLKERYGTIDKLNRAWNTLFWSHTYSSFDQIEAPGDMEHGEWAVHALNLNWKRYCTKAVTDFIDNETKAIRDGGSMLPTTANLMYDFDGYNYKELAKHIDIVSWDNYSTWHKRDDIDVAYDTAFFHDFMRCLKQQPFLLMESCPTSVNWQKVSKLHYPGVTVTAGLQAVAHGSDSVQYFQMRQSRGCSEKFHGALIGHDGTNQSRTYKECKDLGIILDNMGNSSGADVFSEACVIYDRENIWAMLDAQGPRNCGLKHKESVMKIYKALRRQNINVDVVFSDEDFSKYKVVVAPMLYMFRAGFQERIRDFVSKGGTLVMTYHSGLVDEDDLVYLGEQPNAITDVLGIKRLETDALYDGTVYHIEREEASEKHFRDEYNYEIMCEVLESKGAKVLFSHGNDFYKGTPAVTRNKFGEGRAYYVGIDAEYKFYEDLFERIVTKGELKKITEDKMPESIELSMRKLGASEVVFIQNYSTEEVKVDSDIFKGTLKPFETVTVEK